ncbi:MAG: hypothetical protein IJQ22_08965 [Bacteroidales bacterium]|nr:hypothetical protein [Bacteroidales bacterium]
MEGMVMKKEYLMPAVDIISLKVQSIICQSIDSLAPESEFESFEEPSILDWD